VVKPSIAKDKKGEKPMANEKTKEQKTPKKSPKKKNITRRSFIILVVLVLALGFIVTLLLGALILGNRINFQKPPIEQLSDKQTATIGAVIGDKASNLEKTIKNGLNEILGAIKGLGAGKNGTKEPPAKTEEPKNTDIPIGKDLIVDCDKDPVVKTFGKKWYYITFGLHEVPSETLGKLTEKIAELKKKEQKGDGSNSAKIDAEVLKILKEAKCTTYYKLRGGPFAYADYKKFVQELSSPVVQLVPGKVLWHNKGENFLETSHPDGITGVDLFEVGWKSKTLKAFNDSYGKGIRNNFNLIRTRSAAEAAKDIWSKNDEEEVCLSQTLKYLSQKKSLDEKIGDNR
jgi:hypothetical protein